MSIVSAMLLSSIVWINGSKLFSHLPISNVSSVSVCGDLTPEAGALTLMRWWPFKNLFTTLDDVVVGYVGLISFSNSSE